MPGRPTVSLRGAATTIAAASIWLALLCAPVLAQSERRGGTPGVFDFYVLALSWSPGFCELSGGRDQQQCSADGSVGRGFVVHGLWPQFTRGYPTQCAGGRFPSRANIASAVPPFPTEGLARSEWRKHGSCSGLDPAAYFAAAATAFGQITIPDPFKAATAPQDLAPIAIERQFVASNRGLRAEMMSVQCDRGLLKELRICFSRDLRSFVGCPEVDRDTCRSGSVTVSPMTVSQ
jgi:ribonuclease T2